MNIANLVDHAPLVEVVTITPEMAKKLLALNTGNFRPYDKNKVLAYTKDLEQGDWHLTGDTLKITHGILIDGQHRLMAIMRSNIAMKTAVAINIATSGLHVDRGKPRTIGQWLAHEGIKNASNIGAIAKYTLLYDKGKWGNTSIQHGDMTDKEILNYVWDYNQCLQSALIVARKVAHLMPASIAAAIVHIGSGRSLSPIDDELIAWFWNGVGTGKNIEEGDPPFALRARFLNEKINKSSAMTPAYYRWLTTLLWNKAVKGEPAKVAMLRLTGPGKSAVPTKILISNES